DFHLDHPHDIHFPRGSAQYQTGSVRSILRIQGRPTANIRHAGRCRGMSPDASWRSTAIERRSRAQRGDGDPDSSEGTGAVSGLRRNCPGPAAKRVRSRPEWRVRARGQATRLGRARLALSPTPAYALVSSGVGGKTTSFSPFGGVDTAVVVKTPAN